MFLLLAEVLKLCTVSAALPESRFWRFLCFHQSHVEWVGCSLHDLIMPSFCFLVGVALSLSVANRRARGQTTGALAWHTAIRIMVLILLGTLIASAGPRRLTWPFDWVLPQIALGYGFLFLLSIRLIRSSWIALGAILCCYWLAFALYPLPGPDFDYTKVGISKQWMENYGLTGFAAHWQKNSNFAWSFDVWFMSLFPRKEPFAYHNLGLATLNFIPTLATMILGLIAGNMLRSDRSPWSKVRLLVAAGVAGLVSGWLLGELGLCPVVKAIWTPSWVLFSGGWCFLLLGVFCVLVDIWGLKGLMFPLIVIGMNSIAAYCISQLYRSIAFNSLRRIVGWEIFRLFGDAYEHVVYGAVILLGFWLVLFVMYRRKLFLRI